MLDFEKRRNVPIKYDRDLWQKTVLAIKRVQQIKDKRGNLFIRKRSVIRMYQYLQANTSRLLANKEQVALAELKEVEQSIHLIQSPLGWFIRYNVQISICSRIKQSANALPSKELLWPMPSKTQRRWASDRVSPPNTNIEFKHSKKTLRIT